MKKILLAFLISICMVSSVSAQMLTGIVGGGKAPSCTLYLDASSATDPNGAGISHDATNDQPGQSNWSFASGTIQVCKITLKLTKAAGDISGKTFYVNIWSMTGANLNAILATSAGVTGSNSWSDTYVDFTFATPYSMAAATGYAITATSGAVDATNYANVNYYNNGVAGSGMQWSTAKVAQVGWPTLDLIMKIYTMQ